MRELRLDEFTGREGETFEIALGEERVAMVLTRVQPLRPSGRAAGAFVLELRGPPAPVLPQATYSFRRGDDEFDMFIVPLAQDPEGVRYESVFN